MTFKHNGLTYKIIEVEEDDERLIIGDTSRFGLCNHKKQEIYIMKTIAAEQKKRVLIHEVTHMVINANGLYANDTYNQEQLCEFVAYNAMKIMKVVDRYFEGK